MKLNPTKYGLRAQAGEYTDEHGPLRLIGNYDDGPLHLIVVAIRVTYEERINVAGPYRHQVAVYGCEDGAAELGV